MGSLLLLLALAVFAVLLIQHGSTRLNNLLHLSSQFLMRQRLLDDGFVVELDVDGVVQDLLAHLVVFLHSLELVRQLQIALVQSLVLGFELVGVLSLGLQTLLQCKVLHLELVVGCLEAFVEPARLWSFVELSEDDFAAQLAQPVMTWSEVVLLGGGRGLDARTMAHSLVPLHRSSSR